MHAHRLIVCIDPADLLVRPSPALYPEWDRELLVLSGALRDEAWARCAEALAAARSAHVPISLWLLQPGMATPNYTGWETLLADAPQALRERLSEVPHEDRTCLWWAHDLPPEGTSPRQGHVDLFTHFEHPQPLGGRGWGQRFLLPLAMRALLDRQPLLSKYLGTGANALVEIDVTAKADQLRTVATAWHSGLLASRNRLLELQASEAQAQCEARVFSVNVEELLHVLYAAPGQQVLDLGRFQALGIDDQRISAWFTEEAARAVRAWEGFSRQLREEFERGVRQLAAMEPQEPAHRWLAQQSASIGKQAFTTSEVHDWLVEQLGGQTARPPHAGQVNPAKASAEEWLKRHRAPLVRRARRRPTGAVFWGGLVTAWCLSAAALAFGLPLPPLAPWPVEKLVGLMAGVTASWGGIALLRLWLTYRQVLRQHRRASEALRAVHQGLDAEARARLAQAREAINAIVLGRNLEIVERQLAKEDRRRAQVAFHVDSLQQHAETIDGALVIERAARTIEPLRIDPVQRPQDQPAYVWPPAGTFEPVTIISGTEQHLPQPTDGDEALKAWGRLAGASRIRLRKG